MNQKIPEIDEQIAQLIASLPSDHPHTASDGYWKAAIARSVRPYGATHHPHRIFCTVGNAGDPSPDAHAVQNGRGKLMALLQPFRFLGIALYGFLQYQLILILSHLFWQIRLTRLGSPDCSSHL